MEVDKRERELQSDIVSIQKITIVPTILDVICRTTGMGFAAIARVTEDRWITCSLLDKIQFGLKPGDELKVKTTICDEVRQFNKPVVIDDVASDPVFCEHLTPKMYGFRSYISIPIIRRDGTFFGTLCAIDPKPAKLITSEIKDMFSLFSDLIAFHLQAVEKIEISDANLLQEREKGSAMLEQKNAELQKMNLELESFAHVASHDLQEPLRKIETFSNFILEKDHEHLSSSGKHYFSRMLKSVNRMQTLIRDLLLYSQVKVQEQSVEYKSLNSVIEEVKQNNSEELADRHAAIEVLDMCDAYIIPFQFNQLMQNLISNSVKFGKSGVDPIITISSKIEKGNSEINSKLIPDNNYCHISVSDNGIGFEPEHSEKIFEVFQRLHGREDYEGTGIGLSIVKKIVDNHKGVIIATGEVNKGATFDIYLPQPEGTHTGN